MKTIDITSWKRKEHFEFFTQFEEPYFGSIVHVDVTRALQVSKDNKYSFFKYYLHKCILATNTIENFRYRITQDNQVVVYDSIGASTTIMRENETFGFSYIPYIKDFNKFTITTQKEIRRIKESNALFPPVNPDSVIHYSAIPWLAFTGLTHARMYKAKDSIPKISFGKVTDIEGKKSMSVSVFVHHALVDGLHVSRFVQEFQRLLNI